MIDLDSVHLSVTECARCHQPIALPRAGDPEAPAGESACAYCGAAVESGGDDRALARIPEEAGLPFDLRQPPPGLAALGKRPRAAQIAELRRPWEEAKAMLAEPHAPGEEFRAAWLAATLARLYSGSGDAVRERAVLEAALSRLTVSAYRALVLARLARGAAFAGRFALAERWLDDVPPPVGISEIDSDVEVARALLLLRRGAHANVLERLGDSDEGSALTGQARILGDLIRIDALERRGRRLDAYRLYRKAIRVHGAVPLQELVLYYGVAEGTRRLILLTGAAALAGLIVLVVYLLRELKGL